MFCKNCGAPLADNVTTCEHCGTQVTPAAPSAPQPNPFYTAPASAPTVTKVIPEENKPLSPWAYFGLQILFAIPIVGFIFLIVFSCSNGNINRRNFARSYWCALLIIAIVFGVIFLFTLLIGGGARSYYNYY